MRALINPAQTAILDDFIQLAPEAFHQILEAAEQLMLSHPTPDHAHRLTHLIVLQAKFERIVNLMHAEPERPAHINLLLFTLADQLVNQIDGYRRVYEGVLNGEYDDIDIDWDGEPILSDIETISDTESSDTEPSDDEDQDLNSWSMSP